MNFAEDKISTGEFYGPYEDLFGSWMSEETLPEGAFWDFDDDATTDDLLMAWLTPSGEWEVRRDINDAGEVESIDPLLFASLEEVDLYLGIASVVGLIDDLANLNLNHVIALWDAVDFDQFTMRVTATPCTIPPVATASAFSLVSAAHADPVLGEDFCAAAGRAGSASGRPSADRRGARDARLVGASAQAARGLTPGLAAATGQPRLARLGPPCQFRAWRPKSITMRFQRSSGAFTKRSRSRRASSITSTSTRCSWRWLFRRRRRTRA